jgi:hypothetical protein
LSTTLVIGMTGISLHVAMASEFSVACQFFSKTTIVVYNGSNSTLLL